MIRASLSVVVASSSARFIVGGAIVRNAASSSLSSSSSSRIVRLGLRAGGGPRSPLSANVVVLSRRGGRRRRRREILPRGRDGAGVIAPWASSATFSSASSPSSGGGGVVGVGNVEVGRDGVVAPSYSSDRPGPPPPGPSPAESNDLQRGSRFGPLGHDYHLYSNAGPKTSVLSEERIHELLARRLEAKLSRNFKLADSIRDELRWYGVDVDEQSKLWRADGLKFGEDETFRSGREEQRRRRRRRAHFGPLGHDYRLHPDAGPNASNVSDDRIHDSLSRRLEAKLAGKFDEADSIRNELRRNGVDVDDKSKFWRADRVTFRDDRAFRAQWEEEPFQRRREDFFPFGHDYKLDPTAGPDTSTLSDEWIRDMLSRRLEARLNGKFDEADAIRTKLRQRGVDVDDGRKLWRGDGEKFEEEEVKEENATSGSVGKNK